MNHATLDYVIYAKSFELWSTTTPDCTVFLVFGLELHHVDLGGLLLLSLSQSPLVLPS